MSDLKQKIKGFIISNFLFDSEDDFGDDTSFMEAGIIDSTGVLELIDFLEEEYLISVEDNEMIPENLDSLNNLVAYLKKKM